MHNIMFGTHHPRNGKGLIRRSVFNIVAVIFAQSESFHSQSCLPHASPRRVHRRLCATLSLVVHVPPFDPRRFYLCKSHAALRRLKGLDGSSHVGLWTFEASRVKRNRVLGPGFFFWFYWSCIIYILVSLTQRPL